jgi:hypothetical protein
MPEFILSEYVEPEIILEKSMMPECAPLRPTVENGCIIRAKIASDFTSDLCNKAVSERIRARKR